MTLFVAVTFAGQAWADDFTIGNLKYTITDAEKHEVSVGKISDDTPFQGDLVISAEVEQDGVIYKVTSIGSKAFKNCNDLTSVAIPNSITSISDGAFTNCIGLTSVTIPNSVTSIGVEAFCDCIRLAAVNIIGDSITSIGDYAFAGCSSMKTITIPSSVTSIGEWAFSGCWGLTEIVVKSANTNYASKNGVLFNKDKTTIIWYPASKTGATYTIPNSVTSIGERAFYYCSGLTAVTIPNSVTSIGDYAFADCRGLASVTIPESVTSIGDGAFADCRGLTTVTIPSSVTIIGNGAFEGCSSLTAVTIPQSVTDIGAYAFKDCSGLTSVTIPNSVEYIDVCAFTGCSSATIYCEFESRPEDWHYDWSGRGCTVVWKTATLVTETTANAVNIYAYGRNIVVENATEEISVYDVMGKLICRDAINRVRTEIPVNTTGVYIVKVGNIAKRVVINQK